MVVFYVHLQSMDMGKFECMRRRKAAIQIRPCKTVFFDDRINAEKLRNLFKQYVYVHHDKEVMKEYRSPDELDSLGYAFMEIQK